MIVHCTSLSTHSHSQDRPTARRPQVRPCGSQRLRGRAQQPRRLLPLRYRWSGTSRPVGSSMAAVRSWHSEWPVGLDGQTRPPRCVYLTSESLSAVVTLAGTVVAECAHRGRDRCTHSSSVCAAFITHHAPYTYLQRQNMQHTSFGEDHAACNMPAERTPRNAQHALCELFVLLQHCCNHRWPGWPGPAWSSR